MLLPACKLELSSEVQRFFSRVIGLGSMQAYALCVRQARYCGAGCQRRDWPLHRHECAPLRKLCEQAAALPEVAEAELLLAARCLWQREAATATATATATGTATATATAALASDVPLIGDAHACNADEAFDGLACSGTAGSDEAALAALGLRLEGLFPPRTTLARVSTLLVTFHENNFGILDALHSVIGAGCYPRAALLNHSCAPNVVLAFSNARLRIRALRDLTHEEELVHAFVDLCAPTAERRRALQQRYRFWCECERCAVGLRVDGVSVDEAFTSLLPLPKSMSVTSRQEQLSRAAEALKHAAAEDDFEKELALLRTCRETRRLLCHPLSLARYEAEVSSFNAALAHGYIPLATECCAAAVAFLQAALAHVPNHPLLALQRYTLADLYFENGETDTAAETMRLCMHALRVTHGEDGDLYQQACTRLRQIEDGAA